MKQLSIRLLAPASTSATIFHRASVFFARQTNHLVKAPQRLKGKWRLYLNYCPECNSCAPKMHSCEVCQADTKSYFCWSDDIKKNWWSKYAQKHHIAA